VIVCLAWFRAGRRSALGHIGSRHRRRQRRRSRLYGVSGRCGSRLRWCIGLRCCDRPRRSVGPVTSGR